MSTADHGDEAYDDARPCRGSWAVWEEPWRAKKAHPLTWVHHMLSPEPGGSRVPEYWLYLMQMTGQDAA